MPCRADPRGRILYLRDDATGVLMRRFLLLTTAALAAPALLMGSSGIAAADSVSDGPSSYDGADPSATGCNVDAAQIDSVPIVDRRSGAEVAQAQVFYSYSCGTNWIRVTENPYGGNATKYVESDAGGWNSESDAGAGSSYSMMVHAPGNTAISGYVYLFAPGVNEWNARAEGFFSY